MATRIWQEIAGLIGQQPPDEQAHYRAALQDWTHDLRSSLGVLFSAVGILERRSVPEQKAILEMMRHSLEETLERLNDLQDLYKEEL